MARCSQVHRGGFPSPKSHSRPCCFGTANSTQTSPIATTRALIETLPRCDPTYYPDDGHLSVIVNHGHEIIATLASCRK